MPAKEKLQRREFDVLTAIIEEGTALTQREIAQKVGASIGTVNKTYQELVKQGLIADGNVTEAGYEALEPYRVKRAIFLAAGFGSRMVPITFNTPKPLIRVNGVRMIDTLLDAVVAAGIEEIVIVRGYLGEQFDQLLYKYPNIKFVENPFYNEANNISSAMCIRYMLQNAYVLEADFVLYNPKILKKYEYCSCYMGVPMEVTDDWCLHTDSKGYICEEVVGGRNCHQMVGISYWDEDAGRKLANDIQDVYQSPGGKERYWEQVAFVYKKENYKVRVKSCNKEDIIEIDTFNELKQIDKLYDR